MNRIETVDDLNNFLTGLIRKHDRNALVTSRMKTAPRTAPKMIKEKPKSNAVIMANLRSTARSFGKMVSRLENSWIKERSSSVYDPEKVREAREEKFSGPLEKETASSVFSKTNLRVGKVYGKTPSRKRSDYDPLKIKRLREEQASKLESFSKEDGPGKSRAIAPGSTIEGYDPSKVRYLREKTRKEE